MEAWGLKELQQWLRECASLMQENKALLIKMDSALGDGDLGLTMTTGFAAARDSIAAYTGTDLGKALMLAGRDMARAVPSTMGTLAASALMESGKRLRGSSSLQTAEVLQLSAGLGAGISQRGKAREGERTILDALCPAHRRLQEDLEAGKPLPAALQQAAAAAEAGVEKTREMLPVYGRAVYYGDKVLGHPDQGAYTGMLIYKALARVAGD